jgi:hypothetical protein
VACTVEYLHLLNTWILILVDVALPFHACLNCNAGILLVRCSLLFPPSHILHHLRPSSSGCSFSPVRLFPILPRIQRVSQPTLTSIPDFFSLRRELRAHLPTPERSTFVHSFLCQCSTPGNLTKIRNVIYRKEWDHCSRLDANA